VKENEILTKSTVSMLSAGFSLHILKLSCLLHVWEESSIRCPTNFLTKNLSK
jgi:hypothetical protein